MSQGFFQNWVFTHCLAALVPKPRINLTRYHGVLAPNHRWRREVIPNSISIFVIWSKDLFAICRYGDCTG